MAGSSVSVRHDGREGGREKEDKYLCLEIELEKKPIPARQRDGNWEPQMKGESTTGSH